MSDEKQEEGQEEEERVDLSRFTMNVVEGDETDRPAEKPKSTIVLLALVVAGVVVLGGYIAWSRVGPGTGMGGDAGKSAKAEKFLSGLRGKPALQGYLKRADFIDQDRLRIVIADALPQPTGQPRPVTREDVEQVVRTVTAAFSKHRPHGILAVHAYQGDEQVATGLYDAATKEMRVGPPMPITDRSHIGGAFREPGAGAP